MKNALKSILAFLLTAAFSIVLAPQAGVISAEGWPEVVGQWPYGPTNGMTVSGNILYHGSGRTVRISDVSDPLNVIPISEIVLIDFIREITLAGDYAYVACGPSGLRIVDVSALASPIEVSDVPTPGSTTDVAVSGDFAYAVEDDSGLRVIDVSTPSAPVVVGTWYDLDIRSLLAVAVEGNHAYVLDSGRGLRVIDISAPATPFEIGYFHPYSTYNDIVVSGNHVYLAAGKLYVVDVSTPESPLLIASANPTSGFKPRELVLSGNYLFVGDYNYGLRVFDVSTPSEPAHVGYHGTQGKFMALAVSGDFAYVSESSPSMIVFDVYRPWVPYPVNVIETQSGIHDVFATNGYAYVAATSPSPPQRLRIMDVNDLSTPVEVGSCEVPEAIRKIFVTGDHAYVAAFAYGMRIIDVSIATEPVEVGHFAPFNTHARDLFVEGDYAYLAAFGLWIVDVTTPSTPVEVGHLSAPGWFGAIAVSGHYAYVVDYGTDRLRVVDIRTPSNPFEVGSCPHYFISDIEVSGNYVFGVSADGLQIIDVSTPYSPYLSKSFPFSGGNQLIMSGRYIYLHNSDEVAVIDVSDPLAPFKVQTYQVPTNPPTTYVYDFSISDGHVFLGLSSLGMEILSECTPSLFADGFESGDLSSWPVRVRNHADNFNAFLEGRGIAGDYILCTYAIITRTYSYLGQVFNEADGGIGGAPITNWIDLYWKNEKLASTVSPYDGEDPDGDGIASSSDADAFDATVQ